MSTKRARCEPAVPLSVRCRLPAPPRARGGFPRQVCDQPGRTRGGPTGHRVLFATAAAWTSRLTGARHVGRLQAEITRLGRHPLIIIDEVGYIPFEPEAASLFCQLISARYETASVIVTSGKARIAGARYSAATWSPPR
jgi:IstB-like ATP binding protein